MREASGQSIPAGARIKVIAASGPPLRDLCVKIGRVPISFDEMVCSTLATLRIQESVATGKRLAVDTAAFIDASLRTPSLDE